MKLSITTTLYQSAPYIREFYERASLVAQKIAGQSYEIIFVNDGSPDDSLKHAISLTLIDGHIKVVDLSRNFGHHKAMMTGISCAKGDHVFLIDSDLEEEPEWLALFEDTMAKTNCDVVVGVQESRKGGWFERWSGDIYYKIFCSWVGIKIPKNVVTARLMKRHFVNELIKHDEREIFLGGLFYLTGYMQITQKIKKHSSSETTYTFPRKIGLLINQITSFSVIPLVAIFYFGLAIWLLSCIFIMYLAIKWGFFAAPPSGWTTLIASIWFLGGLMIVFLGVIGIYLSKVFIESKRRPYTTIRKVYER